MKWGCFLWLGVVYFFDFKYGRICLIDKKFIFKWFILVCKESMFVKYLNNFYCFI